MSVVLDLQHLHKYFGDMRAVDDMSFTVDKGEIVALLGPSGCGKTTTLRLLAGFETPDTGRIFLNGKDIAEKRPYERHIGLVFQDYALFPHMTVGENIAFGMKQRGFSKKDIRERGEEVLEQVQLKGLAGRRPAEMSGGQQQRVALARALAPDPEIMLLDEPLSNLDAKLRHYLRRELRGILTSRGCTSIIVTHDQEEAMGLADRVILINKGRIEQIDTPRGLYMTPRTRFAADFIGQANWVEGSLSHVDHAGLGTVVTDLGAIQAPSNGNAAGDAVSLCIRPERLRLSSAEQTAPAATNAGPVVSALSTVELVEHLGADIKTWVRLACGLVLHCTEKNLDKAPSVTGAAVRVEFNAGDCIVLARDGSTT